MQIEKQHIVNWLALCAEAYSEHQLFLNNLDRDIGDADHGKHLNRGFRMVAENLPSVEKQNIATILKNTGMALMSNVGGASGPLYGTLFVRAAATIGSREQLSFQELLNGLTKGVDGMLSRGKARLGDKTLCDVWVPTIERAQMHVANGVPIDELLDDMLSTAERSAVSTIEMQAKKGLASHLGQASVGHQDPGATSSLMMIQALVQALKEG